MDCRLTLEINCDTVEELFTIYESSLISPNRVKNNFLSLAIVSEPLETWQIVNFDTWTEAPIFNFFSDHFAKVSPG